MNITLRDLLRWTACPLRLDAGTLSGAETGPSPLDRAVAWPISMRATPPLLPQVEEGALVLLPASVLTTLRESLPAALRELRRRDIAALVLDTDAILEADDHVLLRGDVPVGPELEATVARLLHERRADLYHRAAELDRALSEVALRGAGVERLVAVGAEWSGRDVYLFDDAGQVVASAAHDEELPPPPSRTALVPVQRGNSEWYFSADDTGRRWIVLRGPLGALNEYDRLVASRLAAALAHVSGQQTVASPVAAADHDARVTALFAPGLTPPERRERALTLGLDPTAYFAIVAQRRPTQSERGEPIPPFAQAGPRVGVERFRDDDAGLEGQLLHARRAAGLQAALAEPSSATTGAPMVSSGVSEVVRLDDLPEAWRQARFACDLVARRLVDGPVASWNTFDDLGPYRLLYELWETPAATHFVATVLGALSAYDARHGGVLVPTLLTYLAHGGVAGAAAIELAVHRNTLSYRMRRVAELTGRSPLDPRQQLTLHLATLLHLLAVTP